MNSTNYRPLENYEIILSGDEGKFYCGNGKYEWRPVVTSVGARYSCGHHIPMRRKVERKHAADLF